MRGQRPQRRPAFQQADGQGCGAEAAHGERGGDREGFNSADAIAKPKAKGVPASKLLLGIGFYGRGWTGVTQSAPGGTAKGTVGGTAYAHCGNDWWSYDTPATVGPKMAWAKSQGLGGAFFWEFNGDTANGELVTAINSGLK